MLTLCVNVRSLCALQILKPSDLKHVCTMSVMQSHFQVSKNAKCYVHAIAADSIYFYICFSSRCICSVNMQTCSIHHIQAVCLHLTVTLYHIHFYERDVVKIVICSNTVDLIVIYYTSSTYTLCTLLRWFSI